MDHAVLAGSELNERAHRGENTHNAPDEHIAHLGIAHDALDDRLCALRRLGIAVGSDADRAVLLDVDLGARFGNDGVDDLPLLAHNVANLLGIDPEGNDAGRILGKLGRNFGNAFQHFAENELSALVRLLDRGVHDLFGNALDLDIHLNGGDALLRTSDFEVHIAEEVFKTLNIRHDAEFARLLILDKTHCNACDGSLDRHARVHERHRRTADGSHGRRAVGGENIVDDADRVRELLFGGNDGNERTLRKRAVPDLAAARTADRLRFARAVPGEVVLVHIALGGLFVKSFELLRRAQHVQRAGRERLRLTAGEHGGTVRAGQNVAFAPDGTDVFQTSAVGADALIEDLRADLLFGEVIDGIFEFARLIGIDLRKVRENILLDFVLTRFALCAVESIERPIEFFRAVRAHRGVKLLGDMIQFDLLFGFARRGNDDVLDERADLLDLLMPEHDRADHFVVGDLVRTRLDHEDRVARACKVEVNGALFALRGIGVDDVLAVHQPDHDRTRRTCPRDIGNGERDGRTDHGERLGGDVRLHRESRCDDHDVVEKSLREERTERSVDEARR